MAAQALLLLGRNHYILKNVLGLCGDFSVCYRSAYASVCKREPVRFVLCEISFLESRLLPLGSASVKPYPYMFT